MFHNEKLQLQYLYVALFKKWRLARQERVMKSKAPICSCMYAWICSMLFSTFILMLARITAFFTEFFISKVGTWGLPTWTLEQLGKFKSFKALSFPQKNLDYRKKEQWGEHAVLKTNINFKGDKTACSIFSPPYHTACNSLQHMLWKMCAGTIKFMTYSPYLTNFSSYKKPIFIFAFWWFWAFDCIA